MHPLVYHVCTVALALYLGVVSVVVLRARSRTLRILALDTLTVILAGLFVLFAIGQRSSYYLDAALALALLGFVGTLVAVHFRLGRELY